MTASLRPIAGLRPQLPSMNSLRFGDLTYHSVGCLAYSKSAIRHHQICNPDEPLVLANGKSRVAQNILQLGATLYPPLADIRRLQAGEKAGFLTRLFGR